MIRLSSTTALLLALFAVTALAETTVTVEVLDVKKADGHMYLSVFDGKKSWLKKPYLETKVPVDGQETVSIVVELPPGEYAFHAFQDLDDNEEMKTNFIGIPKEPTAVSNNAKARFGPPKYKDAKVTVGDAPVSVSMNLAEID